MTYQQSLDLAEIEADLALERYLEAFEADAHPQILDQLNVEADLARQRYEEASEMEPAH